jgi:hypothetical protein
MSDVTANLTCGAVHCIILQPWKGIIIPREFQKRHRVFPLSRKQTTDCECINSRHLRDAKSSIENIESFAVLRPTRTTAFKKSSQFPIIIKLFLISFIAFPLFLSWVLHHPSAALKNWRQRTRLLSRAAPIRQGSATFSRRVKNTFGSLNLALIIYVSIFCCVNSKLRDLGLWETLGFVESQPSYARQAKQQSRSNCVFFLFPADFLSHSRAMISVVNGGKMYQF